MNRLTTTMSKADAAAQRAGVDGPPLLLAFDPPQFGGDGRVLVSFGDDPYTAKSVSWYVPADGCADRQARLRDDASVQSAAVHAAAGSDAVGGVHRLDRLRRARASQLQACAGPVWREAGAKSSTVTSAPSTLPATRSPVMTATSTAITSSPIRTGRPRPATPGGRPAGRPHQTVTLIGSPGAGPLQHARDFGIGADNVFVASSSRDTITGLGGRTSDSQGRAGLGLGYRPGDEILRCPADRRRILGSDGPAGHHVHAQRLLRLSGNRRPPRMVGDAGVGDPLRIAGQLRSDRRRADRSDIRSEGHRTLHEQPRRYRGPRVPLSNPPPGGPSANRRRPRRPALRPRQRTAA